MANPVCSCTDKVNAKLKAQGNGEEMNLAYHQKGKEIVSIPILETYKDTGHRRIRGKTVLIPSYCPFCGKKYRESKAGG